MKRAELDAILTSMLEVAPGISDINFTVGQDAVTESQLSEMERTLANLCSQWRALPPGETLELEIELGVISSQSCQPGSPRV